MIRSVRLSVAALVVAGLVAGACAKKKPEPPPAAPTPAPPAAKPTTPTPPPPPPPPPKEAPPRPLTEDEIFARKTIDDLNREKPLGDVFFELDSAALSEEARTTLQKSSEWLKRRTSTRLTVEGHADSRGTNEYNLALGERRAASVRDYLVSLGIATDRLQVLSKGEEQPQCTEETEGCWQKNRRGTFIFTAK